jgi:DNA-binding GntR family transcriptional regulator
MKSIPAAPLRDTNLTEAAYVALRSDLLACRLPPGVKLNIAELSGQLSVSLGAVREALSRLTAEGLVIAEMNRGFRSAPVSETELLDLTSTRVEMEAGCLRRAILAGGVEWESRIVAAHHRVTRTPERAPGDEQRISDEWAAAHKEFHEALVSACDSPWRLRLRSLLYDQTERYRRLSAPASARERNLASEHLALMEAVLARNEPVAVALIASHLNVTTLRVQALAQHDNWLMTAKK